MKFIKIQNVIFETTGLTMTIFNDDGKYHINIGNTTIRTVLSYDTEQERDAQFHDLSVSLCELFIEAKGINSEAKV